VQKAAAGAARLPSLTGENNFRNVCLTQRTLLTVKVAATIIFVPLTKATKFQQKIRKTSIQFNYQVFYMVRMFQEACKKISSEKNFLCKLLEFLAPKFLFNHLLME